jgi:imidazolonepropionase-like amidohydrolase
MSATTVYTADLLWRGTRGSALVDPAVVVDGPSIVWAGHSADLPDQYANTPRRHFEGCTLMPGLIESHAHLSYDGGAGTKARSFERSPAALVAIMLSSARELLSVGVTTVRDLGARDNLSVEARDLILEGIAPGPRMLVAGAQITTTGGHTWQNHARADTPEALRKLVKIQHKAGVDLIKINVTGGFMTPGSAPHRSQFSTDELAAVVDEAHRLGKRVAAHAHGTEGIARAVGAGVDTIEHCTFIDSAGTVAPDLELIDEIVRRGIHVCATATWNLPALMRADPDFVPPVRVMHQRGVKLIAGNDAGVDGVPHRNYVGGLETSVILGVPIEDVLVGATSEAAAALDLSGEAGVIEPGGAADMIAVRGNPLADVSALRSLALVLVRGREFRPDDVDPAPVDSAYTDIRPREEAAVR